MKFCDQNKCQNRELKIVNLKMTLKKLKKNSLQPLNLAFCNQEKILCTLPIFFCKIVRIVYYIPYNFLRKKISAILRFYFPNLWLADLFPQRSSSRSVISSTWHGFGNFKFELSRSFASDFSYYRSSDTTWIFLIRDSFSLSAENYALQYCL